MVPFSFGWQDPSLDEADQYCSLILYCLILLGHHPPPSPADRPVLALDAGGTVVFAEDC